MRGDYIDGKWAVASGVVLRYTGAEETLSVPGRLGDTEISGLGAGAFMEDRWLRSVSIGDTVREIGEEAFRRCSNLEEVTLSGAAGSVGNGAFLGCPKLKRVHVKDAVIPRDLYDTVRSAGIPVPDTGDLLLRGIPKSFCIPGLTDALPAKPACRIPAGISVLFACKDPSRKADDALILDPLFCGTGEDDAARLLARMEPRSLMTSASDALNDEFVRKDYVPSAKETAICLLHDAQAVKKENEVLFSITFLIGTYFFQDLKPLSMDSGFYHVYCRYYLTPGPQPAFLRQERYALSHGSVVTDPKILEEINAKYYFLCLL